MKISNLSEKEMKIDFDFDIPLEVRNHILGNSSSIGVGKRCLLIPRGAIKCK